MARRIAKAVRRQRERALEPRPVVVRLPAVGKVLSRTAVELRKVERLREAASRLEAAALRRAAEVLQQRDLALVRALAMIQPHGGTQHVPAGPAKTRRS